jgi:hypothetical protein
MRYLIVAVCCAALVGSVSVAAEISRSPAQQTVKASDPMNAHAMKTKKQLKKAKKTGDTTTAPADKKM